MLIYLLLLVVGAVCGLIGIVGLADQPLQRWTRILAPFLVSAGAALIFSPLYLEYDDPLSDNKTTVLVLNKESGRWEPYRAAWCPGDECIKVCDFVDWESESPYTYKRFIVEDYDTFVRSFALYGGMTAKQCQVAAIKELRRRGFDSTNPVKFLTFSHYGLTLAD